jgi:hypothetical protein
VRHEPPYPPAPPPPPEHEGRFLRWHRLYWPPIVSMSAVVLLLVLVTTDLIDDGRVDPGGIPGYATLFGIAATGASLSRRAP